MPPTAPLPVSSYPCGGLFLDLACGVAEPGVSYSWDTDGTFDSDLDGDVGNDADLAGCDVLGCLAGRGQLPDRGERDASGDGLCRGHPARGGRPWTIRSRPCRAS